MSDVSELHPQSPQTRRFSADSTPPKPNSRSFEIYYDRFVNLNKPVQATLFHFKQNNYKSYEQGMKSAIEPSSSHSHHLHSYQNNLENMYRSTSMPDVKDHFSSEYPSATRSHPPALNKNRGFIPALRERNTPEFERERRNSFVSNCIHDSTDSLNCKTSSQQDSPLSTKRNSMMSMSDLDTLSLLNNSCCHDEQHDNRDSFDCWDDQFDEEGDLLKDASCKRHHHRRGSVAIKFKDAKVITLDELEQAKRTGEERDWLQESLNTFHLG